MKRSLFALLAALLLVPGDGLSAQPQFGERATLTIDPARSYIFFRAPRKMSLLFLRAPAEADRVVLERDMAAIGRNPPFTKEADDSYTFLIAVAPGTYTFYGQRDLTATGWFGVCMCMGSLRFEAPAGQIVDLGTMTYPGLEATGANGAHGFAFTETGRPSIAIVPPADGASLPARLAGLPVVRARFRAADKMPNYLSLYVDRHPALGGVLGYERDRVIDAQTGRPVDATGD
jgi:hypothetical protein